MAVRLLAKTVSLSELRLFPEDPLFATSATCGGGRGNGNSGGDDGDDSNEGDNGDGGGDGDGGDGDGGGIIVEGS